MTVELPQSERNFILNDIMHYVPSFFMSEMTGSFIKGMDQHIDPKERLFVKYKDHPMLKNEWKEIMDDEKVILMPGMVFVSENYR